MQKNPFVIASLPENPVTAPSDLEGTRIGRALELARRAAEALDRDAGRIADAPGANPAERRARLHLSLLGKA